MRVAKVLMMRSKGFVNKSTMVCALGSAVTPTPRASPDVTFGMTVCFLLGGTFRKRLGYGVVSVAVVLGVVG